MHFTKLSPVANFHRIPYSLFIGIILFSIARNLGVELTWAQVLVFPIVLFGLTRHRLLGSQIPRIIIGLSAVGCLVGFSIISTLEQGGAVSLYFAHLQGDELEATSRTLRARINSQLKLHGDTQIVREPEVITGSYDFARRLTKDNKQLLIWGNSKYLNIRFRRELPSTQTLGEILDINKSDNYRSEIVDLIPVIDPPNVSLSIRPEEGTAKFVSYLLMGFYGLHGEQRWRFSKMSEEEQASRTLFFEQAFEQESAWKSMGHRALALWAVGTSHLINSVSADHFQPSEWECALSAYQRSRKFLYKVYENPELYSAISANTALLYYIRAKIDGSQEDLRRARKLLLGTRLLGNSSKRRDRLIDRHVWKIAYLNLMTMATRGEYKVARKTGEKKRLHKKGKGAHKRRLKSDKKGKKARGSKKERKLRRRHAGMH